MNLTDEQKALLMELVGKQQMAPEELQLLSSYKQPGMMNQISPQYFSPYRERVGLGEAQDRGLNSPELYIQKILEMFRQE